MEFVTTYRRDFLWPYVRVLGNKPHPDNYPATSTGWRDSGMCPCTCLKNNSYAKDRVTGPEALKYEVWSKKAPVGPLLDPKLYPAQVGRSPEVDTMKFNQPNTFLKKLQDKYPFIYEILRTAPPDDMISRINRDRLRTTYQVDYCHMNEYPSAPYDELLRAAGVVGLSPCAEPVRLPGDPCRPNQRAVAFRPATITKEGKIKSHINSGGAGGMMGSGSGGGGQGEGLSFKQLYMWNPYRKDSLKDNKRINEWGQMIYRDRKHSHGNRSDIRRMKKKR